MQPVQSFILTGCPYHALCHMLRILTSTMLTVRLLMMDWRPATMLFSDSIPVNFARTLTVPRLIRAAKRSTVVCCRQTEQGRARWIDGDIRSVWDSNVHTIWFTLQLPRPRAASLKQPCTLQ